MPQSCIIYDAIAYFASDEDQPRAQQGHHAPARGRDARATTPSNDGRIQDGE